MTARLRINGSPVTVVPVEPTDEMLHAAATWRGTSNQARAMLDSADPALTEAVVEMRRVLAKIYHDWDGEPEDMLDAAAILARITVEDASDE